MRPELKFFLTGLLLYAVGLLFIIWGVSDLVSLFNAPVILIFIIPIITTIIFLILFVILVIHMKKKNAIFNEKTIYYCAECGSTIKLEDELCSNCGVENIKRKEALEQLEELEKLIENKKAKLLEKSQSKKRRTPRNRKFDERYLELLNSQARKVKSRKTQLITRVSLENGNLVNKIKCPLCGYENDIKNRICSYCGKELIKRSTI